MSRKIVCGDIHGAHIALKQCLERSKFDFENDTLIQLGDICDGWPYVYEVIEELLKIRNLITIKGNHDDWWLDFLKWGYHSQNWKQGALATAKSYLRQIDRADSFEYIQGQGYQVHLTPDDIDPVHQKLIRDQILYYIDDQNRLYIHGGFNRHFPLNKQEEYIYYWDRDLWSCALSFKAMVKDPANREAKFRMQDNFSEIYIGHTTTNHWGSDKPMNAVNIWNMDTGAGWSGKLTFMDVDTKEIWQSDNVREIYKNEVGRN